MHPSAPRTPGAKRELEGGSNFSSHVEPTNERQVEVRTRLSLLPGEKARLRAE